MARIDKPKAKQTAALTLALITLTFAASFWFYGPMLNGKLTLVDDHEYFLLLGPEQTLPIQDLFTKLLQQTEVGRWGESMRFRPFYFFARALESSLWGLEPSPRFLIRILIAASLCSTFAYLVWDKLRELSDHFLSRLTSFVIALAFGILSLEASSWTDILLRLGPSEIYLALGLIPLIFGIRMVWRKFSSSIGWVLLFSGYLVSILSKENAFALLGIVLFVVTMNFKRSSSKIFIIIGSLFSLLVTAWVEIGIFIAMSQNGGDVYGQSRSLTSFLSKLIHEPYFYFSGLGLLIAFGMEFFSRSTTGIATKKNFIDRFKFTFIASAGLWVILTEAYIYQHSTDERYLFLSQMTMFTTLISLVYLATNTEWLVGSKKILTAVLITGFVSFSILSWGKIFGGETSLRNTSTAAASASGQVTRHINQLITEIEKNPNSPVVLFSGTPMLEHSFAISRIVWFASGEFLFLSQPFPELQTGNSELLFNTTTYSPDPTKSPICVGLAGAIPNSTYNCKVLISF